MSVLACNGMCPVYSVIDVSYMSLKIVVVAIINHLMHIYIAMKKTDCLGWPDQNDFANCLQSTPCKLDVPHPCLKGTELIKT